MQMSWKGSDATGLLDTIYKYEIDHFVPLTRGLLHMIYKCEINK